MNELTNVHASLITARQWKKIDEWMNRIRE